MSNTFFVGKRVPRLEVIFSFPYRQEQSWQTDERECGSLADIGERYQMSALPPDADMLIVGINVC